MLSEAYLPRVAKEPHFFSFLKGRESSPWCLQQLELPYEVKIYKRTNEKLAPPELKAIHPLGKVRSR
jgi:hypothetical protein